MEQLKNMKMTLTNAVQSQLGNMAHADSKELGEAIDMIKDLAEAIYYCTITDAMEKKDEEKHEQMYYTSQPMYYPEPYNRGIDRSNGRLYYTEYSGMTEPSRSTMEAMGMRQMRDMREGRSPISRRNYMEAKQMNQSKEVKMRELEDYLHELTNDITEMIQDASAEEKTMLQQKVQMLASKIK